MWADRIPSFSCLQLPDACCLWFFSHQFTFPCKNICTFAISFADTGDELNNSIIVGKYHQHLQSTPPTKSYGKEMANQKDELAEKFLADYRGTTQP